MTRSDVVLTRKPDLLSAKIDDVVVLMDPARGVYIDLNPTATRIWELTEQPMLLADLVSALVQEFAVTPEDCRESILAYALDANANSFLLVAPAASGTSGT